MRSNAFGAVFKAFAGSPRRLAVAVTAVARDVTCGGIPGIPSIPKRIVQHRYPVISHVRYVRYGWGLLVVDWMSVIALSML